MMTMKKIFFITISLSFIILFSGCFSFVDKKLFRYDLNIDKKNATVISGNITENKKSSKPYHLILLKIENDKQKLVDFSSHTTSEDFSFSVIPGKYLLYAVQEPMVLSNTKRGYFFNSALIKIENKSDYNSAHINIMMSKELYDLKEYDKVIGTTDKKSIFESVEYDKRVALDNTIFDTNNVRLGLWRYADFLTDIGGGIYSLNEYKKGKTPLLFIHGINGSPRNFSKIIESIDKEKFHILVYYYATGINLNYTVDILKISFDKLRKKYAYNQLNIVAHSMGGLVSRGFINIYNNKIEIPKFITLSTPWNGQKFAKLGGVDVGMIIPSFGNVYPNSAFQKRILQTKLPKTLEHHLIFGYDGKESLILDNSNDGVVSLSSQLYDEVQKDTYKIYGFNQNHLNLLFDKKVIDLINNILD